MPRVTADTGESVSEAHGAAISDDSDVTLVWANFPAKLAASKAAGVQAIRLSTVRDEMHLEQLNAHGQTIIGFVLRAMFDHSHQATAFAVTQMGANAGPVLLSVAQRAAFTLFKNELRQFKETAKQPSSSLDAAMAIERLDAGVTARMFLGVVAKIDAAIACSAAAAGPRANPIADIGCATALAEMTHGGHSGGIGPEPV